MRGFYGSERRVCVCVCVYVLTMNVHSQLVNVNLKEVKR